MNELLKKLRVDVIDYVYGSTNPDVDYDVEADQVLEILDEISEIEVLTELHEVCDSIREFSQRRQRPRSLFTAKYPSRSEGS